MNQFSLNGKTALLTGSTRGIGRAILLTLAEAGANVVAHGLEADEGASAVSDAEALGVKASYLPADLGEPGGGRKLTEAALAEGPVDILVLCAALQIPKPYEEITPEEYELQTRINLQATLELLQLLVPPMRERKWGRVLSIGSIQEQRPSNRMMVYAATKSAQTNMIRNLARQAAADGITCNNIAPGVVATDRNAATMATPEQIERTRNWVPMKKIGQPADMAGAALLLCSDAGHYITGQTLFIDGGMSL